MQMANEINSITLAPKKYELYTPNLPVGAWILDPKSEHGNMMISVRAKPTPEQIKHTEEYFGWQWKDL
jgi:hypothetical protein